MSAKIHILPVTRKMNAPAPELPCDCERQDAPDFSQTCAAPGISSTTKIPYEIALDFSVSEQIEDAAELVNVDPEIMIERLIEWGLSQLKAMSDQEFAKAQLIAGA